MRVPARKFHQGGDAADWRGTQRLPRLRSGFRQQAQTPAKRLNFDSLGGRLASLRMTFD
jgi:hypothetical protein